MIQNAISAHCKSRKTLSDHIFIVHRSKFRKKEKKISFSFGFSHETQPWHFYKSLFFLLLEVTYTSWYMEKTFLFDLSNFYLFMSMLQPDIHFQIHSFRTYSADAK